jgi:hypothetical protein
MRSIKHVVNTIAVVKKARSMVLFQPFLSLVSAKRSVKMVRREDLPFVREKANAYQSFQQGLARIRKLNKEIDALLEDIKKEFLEEYIIPDYARNGQTIVVTGFSLQGDCPTQFED